MINLKHNDIKDLTAGEISTLNYENLFNVYTSADSQYFYNILSTVILPNDIDETYFFYYDVRTGDTWTQMSFDIYGDVRAWWLICLANNVFNPTELPKAGSKLKMLKRAVARQIIGTISGDGV